MVNGKCLLMSLTAIVYILLINNIFSIPLWDGLQFFYFFHLTHLKRRNEIFGKIVFFPQGMCTKLFSRVIQIPGKLNRLSRPLH